MTPKKKKSTRKPKPLPKVWGHEPDINAYNAVEGWLGYAFVQLDEGTYLVTPRIVELRLIYPLATKAAALRAIRDLWRKTFGGGE